MRFSGRLSPSSNKPSSASARHEFPPKEPQGFHGIQLWVRGDAHVTAIRMIPPKAPPDFYSELKLVPSDQWQSISVPAGGAGQGTAPGESWTLQFVVSGPPGEFFFELDEVRAF